MTDVVSAVVIELSARVVVNLLWHFEAIRDVIEKAAS